MLFRNRIIIHVVTVFFFMSGGSLTHVCKAEEVTKAHKLIMKSKPAVVRILAGYEVLVVLADGKQVPQRMVESGSGFFVSPDGYIMTNAHVVSSIKDGDENAKNTGAVQLGLKALQHSGLSITPENMSLFLKSVTGVEITKRYNTVLLQDGTPLPYEIKSYGTPIGEQSGLITGKDVAILKVEVKNAPILPMGDSSQVKEGDPVYVIGFPGAADSSLLDKKSLVEATTTEGSISAIKKTADGIPALQTNASATHGNSGGPVLNQAGEVIGLLTFRGDTVDGQEVQGFNFIVPSNTAKEYIAQAGTNNSPGPVDKLWQEGLTEYWDSHFSKAKELFQKVKNLFPHHVEAQKFLTDSEERIARGEDSSLGLVSRILIVGLAAIILIIGIVVFLMQRKKSKPSPPPAVAKGATAAVSDPSKFVTTQAILADFKTGPLAGQRITIPARGAWIGRDPSCVDIAIPDDQISRQHLWLGVENGKWLLRDNNSTNGTFVNSMSKGRVSECQLGQNYQIIIANGVVRFIVTQ